MSEPRETWSGRMDRVTFRLPGGLRDEIDAAVERGEFPSASEAIREAIRLRFSPYTKHEVVFSQASNRIRADGSGESEFFDEDGQMWAGGRRDLQERLTEYYGVEDGQIWIKGDHYDEEQDEVLMDVLTYFDGDEEYLIADGVPQYGHRPSGAACVERDNLPSKEEVHAAVEAANGGASGDE